jgi:hypothetical protein
MSPDLPDESKSIQARYSNSNAKNKYSGRCRDDATLPWALPALTQNPSSRIGLAPSRHPGNLDAGIGQLWMAPRDERKSLIRRYPPNCIKLLTMRKPAGDSPGTKQHELTEARDNATAGIACL